MRRDGNVHDRNSRWAAASGVVAAGTGLVLGELLAGLVSPSVSPMTAVGGAVIDAVPPGVKDAAIALFGTADKIALLTGMVLVIAALAALAGIIEQRRRFAGVAIIAVFGLVGVAAVLTRPQMTPNAVAVPLVAAVVGGILLRLLTRRLGEWQGRAPEGVEGARRRTFMRALAGGAAVTAVGGVLAAGWRGAAAGINEARQRLQLPDAGSPAPAIPAGAEVSLDGMEPLVTPNRDFYRIDTALSVPAIDPDKWMLRVTGMVDHEIELGFAELLAKPLIERHVTIACVSNEVGGDLIGNARWLGWPVRELLAMAGPQTGADMVLSRSSDGWTAGTPLEVLMDSRDAILAVGMNGEPLPLEHGFPVRMIVPGLYGYVSATKWLTELKVTRFADDVGYWTPRGWSARGPIKTSSRIDVPRTGRQVAAGKVMFGGVAWAQHNGIGKVELRVNRGPWQMAALAPGISLDTWYQWTLGIDLAPGQYEVQVRATNLKGEPQKEESRPVAPDGATGFHTIRVDVRP
ncbi:molybdopterin-dependent oxidoreductase [Arthrobacter sp. ISL-48]|uniref:molybdopterin-dependent oxidoreductase n=1 Tax=Arthrobacter sp. ISL-48 TaxID=2819110 RepID=UPI001BE5E017|nr:molybdopterin-dependent oxidoreductase [Arthrobacter sp. ISL-48]MBT2530593.1 molybdopterin-dependent oxidoreductase [Arthrobacter sp. ISL-48]